jgi:hypothetical protein
LAFHFNAENFPELVRALPYSQQSFVCSEPEFGSIFWEEMKRVL